MPVISVIVPVYNSEKYLPRCIESILAQTFDDFEIILVDDGSTDNSWNICNKFSQEDNRIVLIHQQNQGQGKARNVALDWIEDNSDSEWYLFIDSDDYVHPEMFECVNNILKLSQADIVLYQYMEGVENNYRWRECNYSFKLQKGSSFLKKCILYNQKGCWILWDKFFSRKCFDNIRLPEGRIYEDNATVYKILYNANIIAVTDNVLYYYYKNQNSTTNQLFTEKKLDWLTVLEEMINFFELKKDVEITDYLVKRYLNDSVYMYDNLVNLNSKSSYLPRLKKQIKYYFKMRKKKFGYNIRNSALIYNIVYPNFSRLYWMCLSKLKLLTLMNHNDT